jgi:RimJ/RimL family protein N-acetyltransferase
MRTDRLILVEWKDEHRRLFAELNADPETMSFFPTVLSREASDLLVERFQSEFRDVGYCPWAVELASTRAFIGFVGLHTVPDELPFAPNVEIGWRLNRSYWGHGYATEAATASLRYAFDELALSEIVSFTSALNVRSRRVMERIGMSRDQAGDFEHPFLPEDEWLRPHVLYRVWPSEGRT